jgi:hypothetical protein
MAIFGILLIFLRNAVVAQTVSDRRIPRSDLNAVPGSGQSEIRIISKGQGGGAPGWWFNVYVDGVFSAQVEPNIPEKLILQNGFCKLRFTILVYNTRRKQFTEIEPNRYFGEITCELASNSTTIEVVGYDGFSPRVSPSIINVNPLAEHNPTPLPQRPAPRPVTSEGAGTLEDALYRASETLINTLPESTTIAILSVSVRDREMAEFVIDELAYVLVNDGHYRIVDRRSLDAIRNEQNFQLSGEVDDESAVSIGKLLGANIVITGSISGSDSMRRLRLKALDVQTAQIVAMASERF